MIRMDAKQIVARWQALPMLVGRRLQRLLLAVFALLLASLAFYSGNQQLLSQARDADGMIAIYQQLKADIEKNKGKSKPAKPVVVKQQAPAVITTAAVMTRVRALAKKQSLSISEISTDVRQEQDGNRLVVNVEAQGSYRRIKLLLADLQQYYPHLRFDSLRIEKSRRGNLSLWLKFSPGQVGVS